MVAMAKAEGRSASRVLRQRGVANGKRKGSSKTVAAHSKKPAPKSVAKKRRASSTHEPQKRPSGELRSSSLPLSFGNPFPWMVTEAHVRHLTDQTLRDVMRELLVAQAYLDGGDISKVVVNAELKAKDCGADATTPPVSRPSAWLNDTETCWQFKAGGAGAPSRIGGEASKSVPRQVLAAGGRFVLVASGSAGGQPQIDTRKAALVRQAKATKLPKDRIDVLTSELLTNWINEHPAIAARLRGLPTGYMSLRTWARLRPHRDPWASSATLERKIEGIRSTISFQNDGPVHVHVWGRPGVGKTRFVLQCCMNAPWKESVLYVPQGTEADVAGILGAVTQANVGRLVLVVDEVQPENVRAFSSYAQGSDKIRLITIGHHSSPDEEHIEQMEVVALDDDTMSKLIVRAHPKMPPEHIRYIVDFADGYTRLARLAAHAVATNQTIDTRDLLQRGDIKQLMRSMLGDGDRRPLHVLAALTSVGWTGQREEEGLAIARHFGLEWSDVTSGVIRFHEANGIAPQANDLRYISPEPLGVFLALDAIETHGERYRSLYDALPNDQARRAYNERLGMIIAHPFAKNFGEEELSRFFHWSHFTDGHAVERWVTLIAANPTLAASKVLSALRGATDAERLTIVRNARRNLVRGLLRLTAHADAFHDAALALAELAAAENETWSNNASGEFVSRFQLYLGGTAAAYSDRLHVIEELLETERPALKTLAVNALLPALDAHEVEHYDDVRGFAPPVPWTPKNGEEELECGLRAIELLTRAAALRVPDDALVHAADFLAMLLRNESIRERVADFLRAVVTAHPHSRERIRRIVHDVARNSRTLWKDRSESEISWIESLADEFSDKSEIGQLRERVGQPDFDRSVELLRDLAETAMTKPDLVWSQWDWLTSGEPRGTWLFGVALARSDSGEDFLKGFAARQEPRADYSLVAGYVRERSQAHGDAWLEDWVDSLESSNSAMASDLTVRIGDTTRGARRLLRMWNAQQLPADIAARLAFGPWALGPDLDSFLELLETLIRVESNLLPVLHMLDNRIQKRPEELPELRSLALTSVQNSSALDADTMSQYHWDVLARALLPQNVREIARTIFHAQRRLDGSGFFLDQSEALKTLDACIAADANGVWDELRACLTDDLGGEHFVIGFPQHVLGRMPRARVLDWIAEKPKVRAPLIARITAKDFSDESLAAAILEVAGTQEEVRSRFFSALTTGIWYGNASEHWSRLAGEMEVVAKRTVVAGLRRFASFAATELRRMAKQDQGREAEEEIRPFRG